MKEDLYFILMADIIKSRQHEQNALVEDFKTLTTIVNKKNKTKMISPITVTLGDEFQCVFIRLDSVIETLFSIEETILDISTAIKLRYVISKGVISSDINKKIGWGMMGNGLTYTREKLNSIKKSKNRFFIDESIKNYEIINKAFLIYETIVDNWNKNRDFPVITAYNISHFNDYKEVAKVLNKNPDQIWKKEKNLKIKEYFAIKEIITYLCKGE